MKIRDCRIAALAGVLCVGVIGFGLQSRAEAVEPPAATAAPAPPEIEPEVVEELRRAAVLLADATKLSFRAEAGYDVVQNSGQKIEFGSTRRVLVRRPDHFSVEAEQRDGTVKRLYFDGRSLSFFDVGEEAYAVAPAAGDIDAAIDYLVDELETPVPLSDLLRSDLPDRVTSGLISARFAGEETLAGVSCDHLWIRKPSVDTQLWIESGERPLIRRIVITYRDAPGQPQFRANLSDWSFAPDVSDAQFAFQPPEGAEKIPFAPRPAQPSPPPKATTGEQP